MSKTKDCATCQAAMPDLLLDPGSVAALRAEQHLATCSSCRDELAALREAAAALDEFAAPEPSPWFDARLAARLREAQADAPESLWQRLVATLQYSTGRHLRPAFAGAFVLLLLVGGGTVAEFEGAFHHAPQQMSATVEDLQILDRNDQAFQTMDQLLDDSGQDDGPSTAGDGPVS